MKRLFTILLVLFITDATAQSYTDSILKWRRHYKEEFTTDPHSPLTASDTVRLRFFAPDKKYCVNAHFIYTPDSPAFDMMTHSGKTKKYRQYGWIKFTLGGKQQALAVYQSPDLMKQEGLEDYLFIPFNDLTNYESTFGGGRYLDLRTSDIKNGKVVLDFNKTYNMYCAYSEGYSCPIPPLQNRLKVKVKAGERMILNEEIIPARH